ncbi:helix-turn-helix transcriptional regulator [bacterium]|nr:helix-turn-helix transcriptional regulator [bacterium]
MTNLNINEKLGIKICFLRKRLKYSQEKLAELADLNKNTIGLVERGMISPTAETLEKIANALNIELKELVDVSGMDL